MAFDFSVFESDLLDEQFVDWLVNEQSIEQIIHFERLWGYYRNELHSNYLSGTPGSEDGSPYRQAQEFGLPARITGTSYNFFGGLDAGTSLNGVCRKEVVIENDIAWRIDAMIDFLFGKPVGIISRATDQKKSGEINRILNSVINANGGSTFFQELALLGSIYGFVDIVLRIGDSLGGHYAGRGASGSAGSSGARPRL